MRKGALNLFVCSSFQANDMKWCCFFFSKQFPFGNNIKDIADAFRRLLKQQQLNLNKPKNVAVFVFLKRIFSFFICLLIVSPHVVPFFFSNPNKQRDWVRIVSYKQFVTLCGPLIKAYTLCINSGKYCLIFFIINMFFETPSYTCYKKIMIKNKISWLGNECFCFFAKKNVKVKGFLTEMV